MTNSDAFKLYFRRISSNLRLLGFLRIQNRNGYNVVPEYWAFLQAQIWNNAGSIATKQRCLNRTISSRRHQCHGAEAQDNLPSLSCGIWSKLKLNRIQVLRIRSEFDSTKRQWMKWMDWSQSWSRFTINRTGFLKSETEIKLLLTGLWDSKHPACLLCLLSALKHLKHPLFLLIIWSSGDNILFNGIIFWGGHESKWESHSEIQDREEMTRPGSWAGHWLLILNYFTSEHFGILWLKYYLLNFICTLPLSQDPQFWHQEFNNWTGVCHCRLVNFTASSEC